MFVGILEDISTNSRIGELEQTLHRELIMAANLKAMIEKWNFSQILDPYAEIIGDILDKRYPGAQQVSSTSWHAKHNDNPMIMDEATFNVLSTWARNNHIQAFTRRLHICEQLRRGHVVHQPFTQSRNNSGVLFRPRGTTRAVPGRIEAILQEPDDVMGVLPQPRIIVLARTFNPLTPDDAIKDPYRNNPIVGASRFNIMSLFYDVLDESHMHIIEPGDIVSHIAVCSFADPARIMLEPCVVIVDLDMKHIFSS
ncbi:hypothetical protein FRC08_005087 [Ceratobasidium sp. 394]|nr:hypothetical protein FRC08_005087 [Ceratobasidium sp. 394]